MTSLNFLIPMSVFTASSLYLFSFFSRKYRWKADGTGVGRSEVIKWAVYGALIPAWVVMCLILSFLNTALATFASLTIGIAFPSVYSLFRKRGLPFFPVAVISTLAVFVAFLLLYSPPPPENWSVRFNAGVRPIEILYFYTWALPPWIVGMAYARLSLSRGVTLLPIFIIANIIATLLLLPFLSLAGYFISTTLALIISFGFLAVIVWRAGK